MKHLIAITIVAALALPAFARQEDPCPEGANPQPRVENPIQKEPMHIVRTKKSKKALKKPIRRANRG